MNDLRKFGASPFEVRHSTYRKCIEQFSLHSNQQEFEL